MSKKRILIVEDNPMNLELARDLLEEAGYSVLKAETAEEGVICAQKHIPDLILMDISLPGMDGISAIQALKKEKKTNSIPIIALTAHAMKGDEERALSAGCNAYISKPIDTRTFPQVIASFL